MSIRELPWGDSDLPHPDVHFGDERWSTPDGTPIFSALQDVEPGATFRVGIVVPEPEPPTSDDFDSAFPALGVMYFDFGDDAATLIVDPDEDTDDGTTITVDWQPDGDDPVIIGIDEVAAERRWSEAERLAAEDWILRMIGRLDDLKDHLDVTARRITRDIGRGQTVSMPAPDEFLPGASIVTIALEIVPDDELDPETVDELGLEAARASVTCAIQFRSEFALAISGAFA